MAPRRRPFATYRRLFHACALLLIALLCSAAGIPPHAIVAYHDSWSDPPAESAAAGTLATMPAYIAVVDLAFAKPDLIYPGDLDLSQTGLEYRCTGWFLRDEIAVLKARNPDVKVLLSLGGAAYDRWSAMNVPTIVRLVHDLGADGVDIDYEPRQPGCAPGSDRRVHCATDAVWDRLISRLRAALPRPAVLTASVWSVGAFGEGEFANAMPRSRYTGFMLQVLRSPAAADLDLLTIDAYDAGPDFDPMEAYRAYRAVWPGVLALGLAVSRREASGPFFGEAEVELLARQVSDDPNGAMMVYPLLAEPDGAGSDTLPNGRGLARAMCRGLALSGCNAAPP